MKLIRIAAGNWRPDGRQLFHFGTYRVPEDMPESLARRAVEEGIAVIVDEPVDAGARRKRAPLETKA